MEPKPNTALDVPALTPQAADFTSGTDGRTSQVWQRYLGQHGPVGYGFDAIGGSVYPLAGGKPAREAFKAASVLRDICTSNATISTIIDTIVNNVVGTGLTPSVHLDAKRLNITPEKARELEDIFETRFAEWATDPLSCDTSQRFAFHSLVRTAVREWVMSGEAWIAYDWRRRFGGKTFTNALLLDYRQIAYEMMQLRDGLRVFQGVAFGPGSRFVGAFLREMPLGDFVVTAPSAKLVRARLPNGRVQLGHYFQQVDSRQTRGISPIVAALSPAMSREAASEFTLLASLIQTQYAATLTSNLPAQFALGGMNVSDPGSVISPELFAKAREQFYSENRLRLEPGAVSVLPPGDELKFNTPGNPTREYYNLDKAQAERAARAAGLESASMRGDFKDVNYSASRMALEPEWRSTQIRRQEIAARIYQDAYANVIEELVESGDIELPEGAVPFQDGRALWTNAEFIGAGRQEPDPVKFMKAAIDGLANGILTRREICAQQGKDYDKHMREVISEVAEWSAAGLDHPLSAGLVTTRKDDITHEPDNPQSTRRAPAQRSKALADYPYLSAEDVELLYGTSDELTDEDMLGDD